MEVFWARGYEGATLEDLQAAMGGISPPSLYHAFGSKEALFREAADLYVATIGDPAVLALNGGPTAREAMEAMLRLTVEAFCRPGKPHGCMLVLGATNCAPSNKGPQDYLRAIRQRAPDVIKQRLRRGVAEGELPPQLNIDAIAAFYTAILHGLGVRAGDGAPRAALTGAVDGAMAAWEPFVEKQQSGSRPRKRVRRTLP